MEWSDMGYTTHKHVIANVRGGTVAYSLENSESHESDSVSHFVSQKDSRSNTRAIAAEVSSVSSQTIYQNGDNVIAVTSQEVRVNQFGDEPVIENSQCFDTSCCDESERALIEMMRAYFGSECAPECLMKKLKATLDRCCGM